MRPRRICSGPTTAVTSPRRSPTRSYRAARSARGEPLGVLAHEAHHPGPVPDRPPRQPALVGLGLVLVPHDRRGNVPALPAGEHRPVLQVDVLAVEAEALVEAPELLEQ